MSTDDCKKFIESMAATHGFSVKDKWKRIRKYKENGEQLREFQNANLDTIILKEDDNGVISLKEMIKNEPIPPSDLELLAREPLFKQLFNEIVLWRKKQSSEDAEELFDFNPQPSSYHINLSAASLKKFESTGDFTSMEKEIKKFKKGDDFYPMATFISELEYRLEDLGSLDLSDHLSTQNNFVHDMVPSVCGVVYDKENVRVELSEFSGIHFFNVQCGGDWEIPVNFLVYYSPLKERLVAFMPLDDGNTYNKKTKTAYGSERETKLTFSDEEFEVFEQEFEALDEDQKWMDKAYIKGCQQLKTQVMSELQQWHYKEEHKQPDVKLKFN